MTKKVNFLVDLVTHLRSELVAAGFSDAADHVKVDEDQIGIRYFNLLVRIIDARPRTVEYSKVYAGTVPNGQEKAIAELLAKVQRGDDLRPHQSRKLVKKSLLANDGMLNDWGIHHLHPDAAGSKDVLMCHVTADVFYAIGFWPHNNWTFKPIWDALIDSWPDAFDQYVIAGVSPSALTDEQRANIRARNGNVFLSGPDGRAYRPIGGGLSSAGTNIAATTEYDRLCYRIQSIEEQVLQKLAEAGVENPVDLTLLFDGVEPVAVLDEASGHRIKLVQS